MYASTYPHPQARCFAMTAGRGRGRRGRHGWSGWDPMESRGPRARRGDVRAALLILLADEPRNGYQLMQEIEQRSEGAWRPSPGSVYPALAQLEDERLVKTAEVDGNRVFEITDAGRTWVAEREDAPAPWDAVKDEVGQSPRQLMELFRELAMATTQIVRAGDEAQVVEAQKVLRAARAALYRILAGDAPE